VLGVGARAQPRRGGRDARGQAAAPPDPPNSSPPPHPQLEGEVSDALKGRFAPGFSIPQICSALEKAALDPRIAGVAVEISPLAVGGGSRGGRGGAGEGAAARREPTP
jgi:hypothetical protein